MLLTKNHREGLRSSASSGMTILELLIVVAIIGMISAILIPNLVSAVERSRQKRTMADMRSIASAWEARATELNGYAAAGWSWPTHSVSTAGLTGMLSPTYIRSIPLVDAWDGGLEAAISSTENTRAQVYAIRSKGKDGIADGDAYEAIGGTTRFECDIVFSNGAFVQFPDGVQLR
jgi:prepilin-type N-terminal cleavage/methylation domain-containing protein